MADIATHLHAEIMLVMTVQRLDKKKKKKKLPLPSYCRIVWYHLCEPDVKLDITTTPAPPWLQLAPIGCQPLI